MPGIESEAQVEIDVMLMLPEAFDDWDWNSRSFYPAMWRSVSRAKAIKTQHLWEDDIVDIIANHPDVKYRYLIRPQ